MAVGKGEAMLSALQGLLLADKPATSRFGFDLGALPDGLRCGLLCHSQVPPWMPGLMDVVERKYLC